MEDAASPRSRRNPGVDPPPADNSVGGRLPLHVAGLQASRGAARLLRRGGRPDPAMDVASWSVHGCRPNLGLVVALADEALQSRGPQARVLYGGARRGRLRPVPSSGSNSRGRPSAVRDVLSRLQAGTSCPDRPARSPERPGRFALRHAGALGAQAGALPSTANASSPAWRCEAEAGRPPGASGPR